MSVSSSGHKLLDLCYIALMAAVISVCAWITVPVSTVPFTMQTFGIFAALGLLGGRRGTAAVLVYLLLGFAGVPVFAGFTGGAGKLLGVTGGYLLGFLLSALVYWAVTARFGAKLPVAFAAMVLGLLVCYAFGSAWFLYLYVAGGKAITLAGVLGICVVPYVIPDLVKIAVALLLVKRVGRYIKS